MARTKIYISYDLWTSLNSITILRVTAQFIHEEGRLNSLVLAIKEVEKEHSGENIAKYLLDVIKDYEIKKNLGYIVIDNALDNNTIISSLS
jgi:hypothetical protein